ncbi:hypothetical protein LSM04_009271 [Trypanosoma melophagium]|uniref:uncharacterized protein n=1 Tax=Trypanosoma melophagium TaxID=715481 RepID=UPI00351AABE7|nr:hypothetical protein LSM04_009271 [Trypanosoma melophagium]
MGCGASSSGLAPLEKKTSTYIIGNRGRRGEMNPSNSSAVTPADSGSRRGEEYDPIAVAAANPAAVTFTDYRGLQVIAVNATQNKVNTVCRWADVVLGIRERNGGWFGEPPGEVAVMCRSENSFCADDAASTIRPDTGSQYQNRLEVSVYCTGDLSTSRQVGRSQSAQPLERSLSQWKQVEKRNSVEKSEDKDDPPDVEQSPVVEKSVFVEMSPNIKKTHNSEGLQLPRGLSSLDSFASLKKLQREQSQVVEEL